MVKNRTKVIDFNLNQMIFKLELKHFDLGICFRVFYQVESSNFLNYNLIQ
jgi:hypothetical protein